MDLTIVQYIVFVIVAIIIILAVIEIQKRLYRHTRSDQERLNRWVELDTKRPEAREEAPPKETHLTEGEEEIAGELHARARQNGHHAESQKPQF